jgi:hypothetical protein
MISLEAGKLYECSTILGLRDLDKKEHVYGLMDAYTPFVVLENLSWEAHLAGQGFWNTGTKILTVKGEIACVIIPEWGIIKELSDEHQSEVH